MKPVRRPTPYTEKIKVGTLSDPRSSNPSGCIDGLRLAMALTHDFGYGLNPLLIPNCGQR